MPTFTLNGQPLDYGPFVTGTGDDAITHPAINLILMSDADLAAWGVVRIPDPPPPPAPPPPPPAVEVPQFVSRMQARVWMAAQPPATMGGVSGSSDLLDDVDAWVKAQPRQIQEYWANVSDIHRDHQLVAAAAANFGWSSDYVDQMFIQAATVR